MARERMVTRTIEVLVAEVICLDVTTVETSIQHLELTGTGALSNDKLLKLFKKNYETETFKVVAIQSTTIREELYGMRELEFLKYAHKLDDSRKIIEDEEQDEEPTEETPVEEPTEPTEEPKSKRNRK